MSAFIQSLYTNPNINIYKKLEPIEGLGVCTYSNAEHIVDPSNAEPHSTFSFEDIMCKKQSIIQSHFSYGRHKRIDCLCQNPILNFICDRANSLQT